MQYIDIHTHKFSDGSANASSDIICYNEICGKGLQVPLKCCSIGIHPWYIYGDGKEQLRQLWERAACEEVRMIGEAGLDKLAEAPLPLQITLFEEQVACSEELQKPLVVHCVKAWQELVEIHRRMRPSEPWLVHGFRGKEALARQLLREGFYLSFGEHFQTGAVLAAWKERLFAETDDSSLDIMAVYQRISQALDCPLPLLQDQIARNFAVLMDKKH